MTFSQVYTEGITKISADDIRYAKEFGYVIKLLGVARNVDGRIRGESSSYAYRWKSSSCNS